MKVKVNYPFKAKDVLEVKNNFALYSHVPSELLYSDSAVDAPSISIVMPTYKNQDIIFRAIESAINQKDAPMYEIVIVDNNPDEDHAFIDRLKEMKSNRIRYYKNAENIGMFGNFNRCVELAKADEIVFLHSDDMLCDNTLNLLWETHQKIEKEAAILGGWHEINEHNVIKPYSPPKIFGFIKAKPYYRLTRWDLFHAESDTGCGELFNKAVLMRIGGFNPDVYPAADKCLCVLYQCYSKVYKLNAPLKLLGIGNFQTSSKVAQYFGATNYYIRNAIVDRSMKGNRLLKYLIYLNYVTGENRLYGVKAIRKIRFHERVIRKIEHVLFQASLLFN